MQKFTKDSTNLAIADDETERLRPIISSNSTLLKVELGGGKTWTPKPGPKNAGLTCAPWGSNGPRGNLEGGGGRPIEVSHVGGDL